MKKYDLSGKKIAILATDGVEQSELIGPKEHLEEMGAEVELIGLEEGEIQGFEHFEKANTFGIDKKIDQVKPEDYDGLVLPGGVHNPDALRLNEHAVRFVREIYDRGLPVAAICHGPWLLVEAGVCKGRTLTSWPSLKTDINNAGGKWVDEEVHVDQGLVTSRKPADLEAFCSKMVEEIAEGKHRRQSA